MDLQTNGGNPVTSDNTCPPNNFRAYSPQIAGDNRQQPDTPSEQFAFTTSHHNVAPDASDPGHHVEIACQPNSTSAQIDASPPATSSPSVPG
jgi:hypothetical protein